MKKSLKRILCVVLILSVFLMSGAVCSYAKGKEKLVIWSYMNEGEPVGIWQQSVVDKFCELYPDVDVEIVFCGRDILSQFQAKRNDTGADDYPDLISQGTAYMLPLAEEGLFLPLDEALAEPALDQDVAWKDTFIANFMDSLKVDGHYYLIPEGMYTHGFFYDEVMFEKLGIEVPKTWDEFLGVCETLKANGIAPLALDGALDLYNGWWFARFATRIAGFEKLNEAAQGKISWKDDEGFLRAAKYMEELVQKGYFQSGYEGSVFPAAQALFTQGKAGMLLCGAWIPTEMASQTPPTMKMRMFTVPEFPDSASPWHEEIWGNCFAALADAHNPENAIKFLKVYSSMEMQGPKSAIKNPSPLVGAPAVEELAAIEDIVANATSTSTNYGGLLAYAEFYNNILSPLSTKLLTGQLTAEQFIDELDAQTQAYYK